MSVRQEKSLTTSHISLYWVPLGKEMSEEPDKSKILSGVVEAGIHHAWGFWMPAARRRLKLGCLKGFARIIKLLKKIYLENFRPCPFGSNQCYAAGTVLRKYKGNTEYSTKISVQHPVKSIFLLSDSWKKALLTVCILGWRDYEIGHPSVKSLLKNMNVQWLSSRESLAFKIICNCFQIFKKLSSEQLNYAAALKLDFLEPASWHEGFQVLITITFIISESKRIGNK